MINGKIKLIFSKELIDEFLTVAKRPKFTRFFSEENIENLLNLFDKYAEIIIVSSVIDKCRDFKDNFLLELAVDSNADYLITGDNDLLVMKKIGQTKIINWSDFKNKIS